MRIHKDMNLSLTLINILSTAFNLLPPPTALVLSHQNLYSHDFFQLSFTQQLFFIIRAESRSQPGYRLAYSGCEQPSTLEQLFYMKNYVHALVLVLISSAAFAQKISIKGALRDSANRPLDGATVMLLDGKDTSLVSFARSQSTGAF